MATAATTYTFTAGTTAVAAEVNTNFSDLVTFLNGEVIQKDGSKAMTAALTLDGAEPSGSNVAVRRKSAYRSNLSAHPSSDVFTIGGGAATSFTSLGSVTDQFGYTPDYDYTLLVLVTGTIQQSVIGQECFVGVMSPNGTHRNLFGPGSGQQAQFTCAKNNAYHSVAFVAARSATPAATVPTYHIGYQVNAGTVSLWLVGQSWIVPSTRQLPN